MKLTRRNIFQDYCRNLLRNAAEEFLAAEDELNRII